MKNKVIIIVLFLLVVFFVYRALSKKPLDDVSSYVVYYGDDFDRLNKAAKTVDLIIIETAFYDKAMIKELKNNGKTKVFGYMSLCEVSHWDDEWLSLLREEDYLTINDTKLKNETYNNYVGDLTKDNYQAGIMTLVKERIVDKNLDGIFFDTVDWVDEYHVGTKEYLKQINGYETILEAIALKHPELLLIQNRGFSSFLKMSYRYMDGVVWENFNIQSMSLNPGSRLYQVIMTTRWHRIRVFSIIDQNQWDSYKVSQRLKWPVFTRYNGYREINPMSGDSNE